MLPSRARLAALPSLTSETAGDPLSPLCPWTPRRGSRPRGILRFVARSAGAMLFVVLGLASLGPGPATATSSLPAPVDIADTNLTTRALAVPPGGGLAVAGLRLETVTEPVTLLLERFEVFTADARIVVHGSDGERLAAPPTTHYFRGVVADEPGSRVTLAVDGDEIRGVASAGGGLYVLGTRPTEGADGGLQPGPLEARRAVGDAASNELFGGGAGCHSEDLPEPFAFGANGLVDALRGEMADATTVNIGASNNGGVETVGGSAGGSGTDALHTARVAIETDWELYLLVGGTDSLIAYVGDLFAFASNLYITEIQTSLLVDYLSVWEVLDDPWNQTSAYCSLMEFGRHWNTSHEGVDRTISHFLSGRQGTGGIAWTGVLCHTGFDWDHGDQCPSLQPQIDHYGGDYGFSGFLAGNFDIDHPEPVWDIITLSHEIGHNFNSPHGHCYEGIDGVADSVDQCHNFECGRPGCFCGSPALPCDQPGGGCGTIMSYCAIHEGGADNIAFSFGKDHPWGAAPDRIADRMRDHVETFAAREPGCLDLLDDLLFADAFEPDLDGWSDTVDPDGALTTDPIAALAPGSTQGLLATSQGAAPPDRAYLVDGSPSDEHRYRLRFYFDPLSTTMDAGKRHKIATLMSDAPDQRRLLSLVLRKPADGGAGYELLAKAHRDDASWAKTAWIPLPDATHALEVEWLRAGAPGLDDGYVRLWIDGTLSATIFGIDNDEHTADSLRLGLVGGIDPGTDGAHAFDAVEVRRSRYIGP